MRIITLVVALIVTTNALGNKYQSPFVAGFGRFARSSTIDLQTGGQLLLSELNCTACHQTKIPHLQPKRGPQLDGVGIRLQTKWLAKFLARPHAVKPGSTMPDVLHHVPANKRKQSIQALIAFLSQQRRPFPKLTSNSRYPVALEFWNKGNWQRGRKLYHQIGCVACHQPDAKYEVTPPKLSPLEKMLAEMSKKERIKLKLPLPPIPARSIPFADLKAKYTPQSLTFFLYKPEEVRPGGRMPNFQLQPHEAADISAYLLRGQPKAVQPIVLAKNQAQIREGKRLFQSLRCANCHQIKGIKPTQFGKPLTQLNGNVKRSCLQIFRSGLPEFRLGKVQRSALKMALTKLSMLTADHHAHLIMLQRNCYACHRRDKRGGIDSTRRVYFDTVGHVDMGDEGRLPPALDGVGAKLKQGWIKNVISGKSRLRPHMLARMPRYSSTITTTLPKLFAKADSTKQPSERAVFGNTKNLAKVGRTIINSGACMQCHALREERMPGVIGVELGKIHRRLQPQWFREFLRNPAKLRRGTRMPTLFLGGKSPFPKLLHGNVDRQIAAIWAYLKDSDKQPLPENMLQAKVRSFELIPKKRPILLRTFMKTVGPMAIAVGFAQKVHFAFDAEESRVVLAWKGRFLDAHGTWFNRLVPPAAPLSKDVRAMPTGAPFALLKEKNTSWPTRVTYPFRGYRLDKHGVPTFLYRCGDIAIQDCLQPGKGQTLIRRLHLSIPKNKKQPHLWFRAHMGKRLQRLGHNSYINEVGLRVTVSQGVTKQGVLRKQNLYREWLLPIPLKRERTIEVVYQW